MDSNNHKPHSSGTGADTGSMDPATMSYLKGQITFQDYQSMLENQKLSQGIEYTAQEVTMHDSNRIASHNEFVYDICDQNTNSNNNNNGSEGSIDLTLLTPFTGRIYSSQSGSCSSSVKSYSKKNIFQKAEGSQRKFKDRFLNFRNLLSSADDTDNPEDEEEASKKKKRPNTDLDANNMSGVEGEYETETNDEDDEDEEDDDDIDNLDETSNWNDFDIETLNFDKFIKDHQQSKPGEKTASAASITTTAKSEGSKSNKSGHAGKRRMHQDTEDAGEMKAKRRRNRVLPIEIQGLMGEANLAYARGETNRAIDVCLEVIKYAPKACEPFQLLSLLYGEMGENDKALRVGLIAAQLNKDPDEWIQLIQQAVIEGDVDLVLFCYNNAIQCDPKNIHLHIERVRVLEEKKDQRRLILAKLMLLKYVDTNTHLDIYDIYFNQVMAELNNEADISKKIYVLRNDMKKFQSKFAVERLRLLIELLNKQRQFKESISIMMNQCQITIAASQDQSGQQQALVNTPEMFLYLNSLHFDVPVGCNNYIRGLFIVSLINLDYLNEEPLIAYLYTFDAEEVADEFRLIAETYYKRKNYACARNIFHYLLTNVRDCLVQLDIWLKYGNCCNYLDEVDDAINAYRNAVNLDSSNCEAALHLVNMLKKNSQLFDEAATVIDKTLSQKDTACLNTEILNLKINQCFIQYEKNEYESYVRNARQLLFNNLMFVLEPENVNALLKVDSKVQRAIVFHQLLEEHNYDREFNFNKLNSEIQNTIFEIYLKLCKVLVKLKRYDELMIYAVGATVLPLVYERMDWNKSINFTCLISCILKSDGKNAFNILKDFIIEFKNSNKLWSYVGFVISLYPSLNQQKFFIRLGAKYMDHLPLCLINAHFAIMSGTYRYALVEYMNCFKQNPYDPFINLIIAITYCHISCQKYNTKRHLLVSQSLVFLRRYIKFRGLSQETYYNVARVLHQLSLFDLAADFYNKCLETPCFFPDQEEVYSLKRFAAYNLVQIYKHSNSSTLARHIVRKYLTI